MPSYESQANQVEAVPSQEAKPEGPEGKAESPESKPKDRIKEIEAAEEVGQERVAGLETSIDKTTEELNKTRESLGLPPLTEEPHSLSTDKESVKKLEERQEELEQEKETLADEQEKEKLVGKEKEKILQEKIDELFKEFGSMGAKDFESLLGGGKKADGSSMESGGLRLDPKTAKGLAAAFKEGLKLLPGILKALPGLMKEFDESLTKEAEDRVEKRLKEEKEKPEADGEKEDEKKAEAEMDGARPEDSKGGPGGAPSVEAPPSAPVSRW